MKMKNDDFKIETKSERNSVLEYGLDANIYFCFCWGYERFLFSFLLFYCCHYVSFIISPILKKKILFSSIIFSGWNNKLNKVNLQFVSAMIMLKLKSN